MRLNDVLKFQKALALAASVSNPFEAAAAESAVRRIMESRNIDPTRVPNQSFVSRHINFANNTLLQKLREEFRALHPLPSKKKAVKPETVELNGKIAFSIRGYRKVKNKNDKLLRKKRPKTPRNLDWTGKAIEIIANLPKGWCGRPIDWRPFIEDQIGPPTAPSAYGSLTGHVERLGLVEKTGKQLPMPKGNGVRLTNEYVRTDKSTPRD